jgi:hypothetical protein
VTRDPKQTFYRKLGEKNRILAVREFGGSHSGKNIAKLIKEILSKWEIEEKVHIFFHHKQPRH